MKNNYLFTVLFFLSVLFTGKTYAQNPVLIVEGDLTNVTNDYIYERERCVEKGTQLIDCSYNGSYILFDIKPTESGKYLFTSAIATKNDGIGCTVGYVDENKEFIESATLDIANTGNWSKTLDYQWVFDLEADRTYSFMMKCVAGSGYAINAFTLTIKPYEAVNIEISEVNVNGFSAESGTNGYSSSINFEEDAVIEIVSNSINSTVTFSAEGNNGTVDISSNGVISAADINNGDVIIVTAIVREEESEKEVAITLNATDTKKVQLRGTDTNYGYWTQIGNSNMVCSWTDYSFTLTPSEDTGRLSNGYWTPTNKNRTYGYCVNNATITFTAPDSYQITSVKFFGDAASSVELSGNCNITPSSAVAFAGNSNSDNMGTLYFEVENHVSGEPLTISVTNGQCNIYMILEYREVRDNKAPELISQNIADNAVLISRNGCVSLCFNEGIVLTDDLNASFDGVDVTPVVEDNVYLNYYFYGLPYNSNHSFVIAGNSIADNSGNILTTDITVNFEVGDKPIVNKKVYDFIIGIDGTADEAFAAANAAGGTERFLIFVPNGSHKLEGNADDHKTDLNRSYVSIIGQSKDDAVLCNEPESYGISTTATVHIKYATQIYMQDLTLRNLKGDPIERNGQQIALYDRGNKNTFKNVKLDSYQDTYVSGHRAYFEDCEIRGGVDYICGGGDVLFSNCLLYNNGASGNKITAPGTDPSQKWGYVFLDCTIDGGDYVLARPWQGEPRAYFINTKMNRQPAGNGYEGMSNLTTHFYEYNSMDYSGNALSLSARGNSESSANKYTPILAEEEVSKFTIENILGGTDGWVPTEKTAQVAKPVIRVDMNTLSWNDNSDALCTVIFKDDVYYANTIASEIVLTEEGVYTVHFANEMGGLGEGVSFELKSTGVVMIETEGYTPKIYYDLLGRKLEKAPAKGFYIVNGKKMLK